MAVAESGRVLTHATRVLDEPMITKPPQRQDSTATGRGSDPRANYIHLGTDTQGSDHVYRTIDETILVITSEGDREHVESLDGRSVHEWMTFVADVRSWDEKYLVNSFDEFLAAGTEDED